MFTGLASNGGLYLPTSIPILPSEWQSQWANHTFQDIAYEIMSRFIPSSSIPSADLRKLINTSYSTFSSPLVTPLRQIGESRWVLELHHGPTLAFKDVALQFLGNLFSYFLQRRNANNKTPEHLTIIGATSGDTGSAAIAGVKGKPYISIFMTYPLGRVSPIQEAQMTTVQDSNVFCVGVEDSDFDSCQTIVKNLFSDREFNQKHRLGAVNSINWARILAQITYYVSAVLQLPSEKRNSLSFIIPTGNFGDALAGYYATKMMSVPAKIVIATNENDTVAQALKTGRYGRGLGKDLARQAPETAAVTGSSDGKQSSQVKATHSPAMDILLSSNWERILVDLALETGDGSRKGAQDQVNAWMDELKKNGTVDLGQDVVKAAAKNFVAHTVTDEETLDEIREMYKLEKYGPYVIDPHTAVGCRALRRLDGEGSFISLATAAPAKFAGPVEMALNKKDFPEFDFRRDVMSDELKAMEKMKQRIYKVKGEADVRNLIDRVQQGDVNGADEHAASI